MWFSGPNVLRCTSWPIWSLSTFCLPVIYINNHLNDEASIQALNANRAARSNNSCFLPFVISKHTIFSIPTFICQSVSYKWWVAGAPTVNINQTISTESCFLGRKYKHHWWSMRFNILSPGYWLLGYIKLTIKLGPGYRLKFAPVPLIWWQSSAKYTNICSLAAKYLWPGLICCMVCVEFTEFWRWAKQVYTNEVYTNIN